MNGKVNISVFSFSLKNMFIFQDVYKIHITLSGTTCIDTHEKSMLNARIIHFFHMLLRQMYE